LICGPLERNGDGRGFVSGTMATETHLIKVHGDLLVGGLARTLSRQRSALVATAVAMPAAFAVRFDFKGAVHGAGHVCLAKVLAVSSRIHSWPIAPISGKCREHSATGRDVVDTGHCGP